jgi:membrane carboxypeptidase/penicillin-binding protein
VSSLTDAWFAGYTPALATTVWVGYPNERAIADGYGGTIAAPIWRDYMAAVSRPGCSRSVFPAAPWSGRAYRGAHAAPAKR